MTKYEVIIYWSEEDEAFVAEVPELPGCAAHDPHKAAPSATRRMRFACGSTLRKSLATLFPSRRDAACSWRDAFVSKAAEGCTKKVRAFGG
jgi:hypothetical protein